MLSIVVSTIAFFVAGYYLKRWADGNDFPKGMTLSVSLFVAAVAVAYVAALIVDKLVALGGG